ncbi:coiled-coil domain-containing protein 86 [Danio aesculapii]|uniref:coiled-coil domain-containing protein 86 n=1 Tax=Danio aesculapii TaxID=1142201 RepID=UPI0024C0923B|nr:coiled-coil domain-containing protein 86 [Danio aesculapii]
MSKSKESDGGDAANLEGSDNEVDSPVVSRTRSGRRIRTPAAKTSVRRTRKSVVPEEAIDIHEEPTEDAKTDQSSSLTETACPDVNTAAAEVSQESAVSDNALLMVSDQTSEKENVENNKNIGSTGPVNPEKAKKAKKRTHSESSEKKSNVVPLGKPKSGRVWKDRKKQRFSALLRDKPLCTSWEKKMEAKREKQQVKLYHQQLKDEQAREKEEKKKRRAEHLKRRAENEKKAEIVQVIKNTAKIKRMKKKQLRKIEKRDTLSMVQKTPPKVKKSTEKTNSSS